MDYVMLTRFNECKGYIKKLKMQSHESRDNIRNCVKGELLDEYLKSCDIVDLHIKKIEKELQELQECLVLLESQSLV